MFDVDFLLQVCKRYRAATMHGSELLHVEASLLQGIAEKIDPPNNNGYERTQCWSQISQALTALTPFVDITAAEKAVSTSPDLSRSTLSNRNSPTRWAISFRSPAAKHGPADGP